MKYEMATDLEQRFEHALAELERERRRAHLLEEVHTIRNLNRPWASMRRDSVSSLYYNVRFILLNTHI